MSSLQTTWVFCMSILESFDWRILDVLKRFYNPVRNSFWFARSLSVLEMLIEGMHPFPLPHTTTTPRTVSNLLKSWKLAMSKLYASPNQFVSDSCASCKQDLSKLWLSWEQVVRKVKANCCELICEFLIWRLNWLQNLLILKILKLLNILKLSQG